MAINDHDLWSFIPNAVCQEFKASEIPFMSTDFDQVELYFNET